MSHANQMSYGQVLDVAAWQQARRREFLPMELFVVTVTLAVALLMGTLCAGWFTMLLLGADREAILTELTGATYFAYWQTRHGADMAAQADTIWQGGVLGYGVWLLPWNAIAILSFWPTLRRNETLVAERDPLPLPDSTIPVPPVLSTTADRVRNPSPPTEVATLITASKPSKPDRLHDLNVLRMMRVANERTVREIGALPAAGLPVMTKQKASHLRPPWQQQVAAQYEPEVVSHEENDEMKRSRQAAVAATLALAACSQPPVASSKPDAAPATAATVSVQMPSAQRPQVQTAPVIKDGKPRWDSRCADRPPSSERRWEGYSDKPVPTCLGPYRFAFPMNYYYDQIGPAIDGYGATLILQWPDLQPMPPGVDFADSHETVLRAIRVGLDYLDTAPIETRLQRSIQPSTSEYRDDPSDNLGMRLEQPKQFGLTPYYVDLERLGDFYRQRGTLKDLDDLKSISPDWYLAFGADALPTTVIRCDHHDEPDGVIVEGDQVFDAPDKPGIAQCDHAFVIPELKVTVDVSYDRVFLKDWLRIEDRVRGLLQKCRVDVVAAKETE